MMRYFGLGCLHFMQLMYVCRCLSLTCLVIAVNFINKDAVDGSNE